jgi:hypothetical protein
VEVHLRQFRGFHPGPFDGRGLKVESIDASARANKSGEKKRVVPVSHRGIDGSATGLQASFDEEVGQFGDAGQ